MKEYFLERCLTQKRMEKVLWSPKRIFSREIIKMTSRLTVVKKMLMESIEVSLLMDCGKAMGHLSGIMAKHLKESGKKEQKMGLGFGNHQKETFMKGIGY